MKNNFKSILAGILFFLIFSALFIGGFLYATSPEVWYAGMHGSNCEATQNPSLEDCECYNRFLGK